MQIELPEAVIGIGFERHVKGHWIVSEFAQRLAAVKASIRFQN